MRFHIAGALALFIVTTGAAWAGETAEPVAHYPQGDVRALTPRESPNIDR